jgi:hypothetical protein
MNFPDAKFCVHICIYIYIYMSGSYICCVILQELLQGKDERGGEGEKSNDMR